MIPDRQYETALSNLQAAIDLAVEQLGDLRRLLHNGRSAGQPAVTHVQQFAAGRRRPHSKSPPSTLYLVIHNRVINETHAADGLVKAIELMGPDRIEKLGLRLGGQALVVRGAQPAGRGYHRSGDYWIATHSDTAEKREILESACRRLGLSCLVQQRRRY